MECFISASLLSSRIQVMKTGSTCVNLALCFDRKQMTKKPVIPGADGLLKTRNYLHHGCCAENYVHPKFLRGLCTKVFTWEGTLGYDFVEMKSQIRSHRTVLELDHVWILSRVSRVLVLGVCLCASSCVNFALLLLVSYTHSASSLGHNMKRRKRVSCILLRLVLATSKKTA
jgi:hypothetical protein